MPALRLHGIFVACANPGGGNGHDGGTSIRARRLLDAGVLSRFLHDLRNARLAASRVPPGPRAPARPRRHVLLAGDSLALGVGAHTASAAFAGRIAAEFDGVAIERIARVGARSANLKGQLAAAARRRYDAILITIGGNDIIRFTRRADFERALRGALRAARAMSRTVIVTTSANVGSAPLFPWPLSTLLGRRSLAFRDLMRGTCRSEGVTCVNYIFEGRNVFGDAAFAADKVHPSDDAYGACYEMLKRGSPLSRALR